MGVTVVVGFGASGEAATRLLRRSGSEVVVVDDSPDDAAVRRAGEVGVVIGPSPSGAELLEMVSGADLVVPSPGVPERHPIVAAALSAGVPVAGEVELAARSIHVPVVAVTGTNGKTSVVTLATQMLNESGRRAVAAGNIGLALSDVVDDVEAGAYDVVVAEVSSFQLRFTERFHPAVAVWLNLAPDHLDWHPDMESYVAAKARIWANQGPDDVAVVNAEDPVVTAAARLAPGRVVTFGPGADWEVSEAGELRGPDMSVEVSDRIARLPHERANAAAAAAAAWAAGATTEGLAKALAGFEGLAHRLTLVAEQGGVSWYDDSKATNPAAVVAAVGAFASVVLIAGGRNKGLDLAEMGVVADRVRAVVAIGESAGEVDRAFAGRRPVRVAASMDDAVRLAGDAAYPGDAVVLSPGCASFDWYRSYAERGDDFARAVRDLLDARAPRGAP